MQFPDRSPRPQVSFKAMSTWNKNNRSVNSNELCYEKDDDDNNKRALISDWQDVLSQRWIDVLFNATSTKVNEPWFNNNMRKFILSFLEKYEILTDAEKKAFKEKVQSLILTGYRVNPNGGIKHLIPPLVYLKYLSQFSASLIAML